MKPQQDILKRAYLAAVPFVLLAVALVVKLFVIQYEEGDALRAEAAEHDVKEKPIPARRGNIYSSDEKLMATSMQVYTLYMDPVTVQKDTFYNNINALAEKLHLYLGGKTTAGWRNYIVGARQEGDRYILLANEVPFPLLQKIKTFPIFRRGKYGGGLIKEPQSKRQNPLGKIAERTIGYHRYPVIVGLEGAYNQYLKGKVGSRLMQRVKQRKWKPISESYTVTPRDGYDVVSTINSRMQDWTHHALLRALKKYEADHGCAVVMETATGAIKAIANLGRTKRGTYYEKRNYAVWESTEPGSTFKLASALIALEDGMVDTNSRLLIGNGRYRVHDRVILDSHEPDKPELTLNEAFAVSSNVGISRMIYENYRDRPADFINRLYALGLNNRLGLSIKGEGHPQIPTPNDAEWSAISLPWISFGYQVQFTPLQILTLYNAVANDGEMVKPQFLESIRRHGQPVEEVATEVLNPAICSQETLGKLQYMLRLAVKEGTGKNIDNPHVALAGKTGTSQQNYWLKDVTDYQASFVGYFPAHNPRYSCIVVINKPNYRLGYYGSVVAAPVFAEIAKKINGSTPVPLRQMQQNEIQQWAPQGAPLAVNNQKPLPNFEGKPGAEALAALENAGYQVSIEGNGFVRWQYPPAGQEVSRNQMIELHLQ